MLLLIFVVKFCAFAWSANRNIGIAPFFFEAPAQIIMTAVYGAGSAGAFYKIVPMFGFDLVAADVATDGVFDDHWDSSFVSSADSKTPIRIPSINPDF